MKIRVTSIDNLKYTNTIKGTENMLVITVMDGESQDITCKVFGNALEKIAEIKSGDPFTAKHPVVEVFSNKLYVNIGEVVINKFKINSDDT